MPVNRKEVNKIKKSYPNFWARNDGYYNFIHETRETQQHHYYHFLKDFARAMVYGANKQSVLNEWDNRIVEYNAMIDRLNKQDTLASSRDILVSQYNKHIAEIQQAKEFVLLNWM